MTTFSLVLSLLLGPAFDTTTHWFNKQACAAFPDHACAAWHVVSARRCGEDEPTTCVTMTHPTVWNNFPHEFLAVYATEGLVSVSVRTGGAYRKIF